MLKGYRPANTSVKVVSFHTGHNPTAMHPCGLGSTILSRLYVGAVAAQPCSEAARAHAVLANLGGACCTDSRGRLWQQAQEALQLRMCDSDSSK